MKWQGRRQSKNISNVGRGGGGRGVAIGGGGLILALLVYLLTGDPQAALDTAAQGGNSNQPQNQQEYKLSPEEQQLYDYSAVVLADTEDAWEEILGEEGIDYRPAQMKVFKDSIRSGCGLASSRTGPFYCSRDNALYMDLSFYDELINRFGAKEGDFVLSYVISHEIGHHVQNVTGIMSQYQKQMAKLSKEDQNALTVRLELQADYLAGVVARYQEDKGYLDPGALEEAISTAWVIGDATIQKRATGEVRPESHTHGTSEQRAKWYKKGYDKGDLSGWDTFSLDSSEL